ncbi:MAG TPA: sugar phosphate isomerase/epimerase [Longimicrobium sp.]|jgi:sugar phosphate isomerase/epimerase
MTARLGWSTLGLPPLRDDNDIARALEVVTESGFTTLEVHINEPLALGGPRLIDEALQQRLTAIVHEMKRRGGNCLLGLGGRHLLSSEKHQPTLFAPESDARALRLKLVSETITLAGELGVEAVIFLSGPSPRALAAGKHGSDEWARFLESMSSLVRSAERAGVVLAPEAHSRHLFAGLADLTALRAAFPSPAIGFTGDTVHQTIVEGEPLEQLYARAAPVLTHIQLDNLATVPAAGAAIAHAPITAAGAVDLAAAIRGLRAGGYQRAIGVEFLAIDHPAVDPLTYCREAGTWLRRHT